jgi:uncharacterized protein (DUF302 family)
MVDEARRVVVDLPFEAALGETTRTIRAEGLEVIGRIDVRDHFKVSLRREFRQYELIEAWPPADAFEALRIDLDAGAALPLRFALYELADGETAVIVDDRGDRAARVLERLRRLAKGRQRTPAA